RPLIPFAGYLSSSLSCFSPWQPARFSRAWFWSTPRRGWWLLI
ncbi:type-F conjugative transfer system protein TrbI, partial [Klebsiella pneumoniae]